MLLEETGAGAAPSSPQSAPGGSGGPPHRIPAATGLCSGGAPCRLHQRVEPLQLRIPEPFGNAAQEPRRRPSAPADEECNASGTAPHAAAPQPHGREL